MLEPSTQFRFLPEHKIVIWHPKGILDIEMASITVNFLTFQEKVLEEPFNRFADWSKVSEVHINMDDVAELATRRRETYRNGPPVKSAFFATNFSGAVISGMFADLMKASPITVRVFLKIEEAADWLGVPLEALEPGS